MGRHTYTAPPSETYRHFIPYPLAATAADTAPQVAYSIIYVLPLYGSAATRPSPSRSRDDPAAIRARIRAVTLSTTACSLATLLLLARLSQREEPALYWMGYWPLRLVDSTRALILTATLFAGPLYERLLIDGGWQYLGDGLRDVWNNWPDWRNIVAVSHHAVSIPKLAPTYTLHLLLHLLFYTLSHPLL